MAENMNVVNTNYQEKKAARIERYRERAEQNRKEYDQITQGDYVRWKDTQRGLQRLDKAAHYDDKADSAERRRAIDSDDPEAIAKLKAKITNLTLLQERMKAANKICRRKLTPTQKELLLVNEVRLTPEQARECLKPSYSGRLGFPRYALTNNSANINTARKRLEKLQELRENPFEGFEMKGVLCELVEGQVQVEFDGKPDAVVRNLLKRSPIALKWSRYSMRWVRKYTPSCGEYFRKELMKACALYVQHESEV